jgi:ferrous iron transport protein B
VVCVVDATNLRRNLRLVLAVRRLGLPCVVALNMVDLARRRGLNVDPEALAHELGLPVVSTVAVHAGGDDALRQLLEDRSRWPQPAAGVPAQASSVTETSPADDAVLQQQGDHAVVQALLQRLGLDAAVPDTLSDRIDRIVLHPVFGLPLLAVVLFLVFQALFSWAQAPMDLIKAGTEAVAQALTQALPDNALRSLLVDGVVAGAGGVIIFLPQIVILFFFILVLEESGYLPRAAFLLDRVMGGVGLSGRSFIPLLSSFACAIPGIMAARTIADPQARWLTIMVAPLMTCSARLPVYALLIGAFVPARTVAGGLQLQGLVMFGLYVAGVGGALALAWVLSRLTRAAGRGQVRALMMELPGYHWPAPRHIALGLWQRVVIFMKRVGGIILVLTIALWALSSFPAPPAGATGAAIEYSLAGRLGHALAMVFEPIGFNWQISIALVPGLAAREVAVSSLGTVYALSAAADGGGDVATALMPLIASQWSLATALSLLAWYVFAPQCLSTLATVKRESGGWTMPLTMAAMLFTLAYAASFVTYRSALALGWG